MNGSSRRAQRNLAPPDAKRGVSARGEAVAEVLWRAWQRGADEAMDAVYAGPFAHGFHSWPAGLHPAVADELLLGLAAARAPAQGEVGDRSLVADPFVGGGTVALAAAIAGHDVVGVDLNPLSRLVASERCRARDAAAAAAVVALAADVCERSKARVRKKVPVHAEVPPAVAAHFAPHTLLELAGLLAEIHAVPRTGVPVDARRTLAVPRTGVPADARRTLAVCFSAILTKASRRRGDTDGAIDVDDKRVGRFLPSEWWLEKVQELTRKQQALAAHHERRGRVPDVAIVTDDALRLARHVGTAGADLIITSPPYGGTYDYIDHHADRLAFLGLDDRALDRGELFARRRPSRQAFDDDTRALLGALAASLAPPGLCVLVVGDGLVERGGRPELVDAARQLEALAPAAGLALLAVASAPRADFYREGAERHEHLVVLAHR